MSYHGRWLALPRSAEGSREGARVRGGYLRELRSVLCVQVLTRSTFFLPSIPLPLLEMGETINAK